MTKFYKVGGCVRDKLLGLKSKDIDYAVEADSFEEMEKAIINRGCKIFMRNQEFLTIRASHPQFGGVDYVLCRKDGQYFDGRRPSFVEMGTIYDDLNRRDFCFNAMAEDEDGNLLDPHDGKKDLKEGLIRCVGDPYERFAEDALRILRAIRFAVRFDFGFEGHTSEAMDDLAHTITKLPTDRIRDELEKCFRCDVVRTITLLHNRDMVECIFDSKPELWLLPTSKDR